MLDLMSDLMKDQVNEIRTRRAAAGRPSVLLSGHQPVYLPGIILFNKIALSDLFMFVGHCQYVKKSWHARNRIRLADHELWLSVPVMTAGHFDQSINQTRVVNNEIWKRKHLGSIGQAYRRAPYFQPYYAELEATLLAHHDSLGDLDVSLIRMILRWLGIQTPILDSRNYEIQGNKTDMLISMCHAAGADRYLSNEGSRVYVDERQMEEAGIIHCWQIFEHPVYTQGESFMPNLSVIDLIFNTGPAAGEIVRSSGHVVPGACASMAEHA